MTEDVNLAVELVKLRSGEMPKNSASLTFHAPPVVEAVYQPFPFAEKYNELLNSFLKYGQHLWGKPGHCSWWHDGITCDCGLQALRDKYDPPKRDLSPHGYVVPK